MFLCNGIIRLSSALAGGVLAGLVVMASPELSVGAVTDPAGVGSDAAVGAGGVPVLATADGQGAVITTDLWADADGSMEGGASVGEVYSFDVSWERLTSALLNRLNDPANMTAGGGGLAVNEVKSGCARLLNKAESVAVNWLWVEAVEVERGDDSRDGVRSVSDG